MSEQTPITDYVEPLVKVSKEEQRVRTPLFPAYKKVRYLLAIWQGRTAKKVTKFQATINGLTGTPQNTVNWTDPDSWIPERLEGEDRELAEAVWVGSKKTVNPRYTYGTWLLCNTYELMKEGLHGFALTDSGKNFLEHPFGTTEAFLDEQEGVLKLLALVADHGPAKTSGLLPDWIKFLERKSLFGSSSTYLDTLRRRLRNLVDRNLVIRKSNLYSISEEGLTYLKRAGEARSDDTRQFWSLLKKRETTVRAQLRELLLNMDPYAFEHLVKRLLEEMNYQNVEVTARSGDGGADVVADIELGITSVREVVQAKRHKRTIQRKDLDALRGSLYRFNAVRGTIIATSRFAKGAQEAAFAKGAPPITLIDGEKLIDFLIEYGIGVRKRTVELLDFEPEVFDNLMQSE